MNLIRRLSRTSPTANRTRDFRLQADLNAQGPLDDLSPDQVAVLRGDRVTQPAIAEWNGPIPLVLSAHDYQPDGPRPRPGGDIIWLDPRDEATFLASMEAAGLVRLAEHVGPGREENLSPIA